MQDLVVNEVTRQFARASSSLNMAFVVSKSHFQGIRSATNVTQLAFIVINNVYNIHRITIKVLINVKHTIGMVARNCFGLFQKVFT